MTQLELELEWITNPNFVPSEVVVYTNRDYERYDQQEARNYGYKDVDAMIAHNNKKHRDMKLRFGSLYLNKEV